MKCLQECSIQLGFNFSSVLCVISYYFLMGKETEAQRGLIVWSRSHSPCSDRPEVELRSSGCEAGVCSAYCLPNLAKPWHVCLCWCLSLISKPTERSYDHPHYLSPGVLWLPPTELSLQAFSLITWRSYLPSGALSPWRATSILPPLSTPAQIYGDFFFLQNINHQNLWFCFWVLKSLPFSLKWKFSYLLGNTNIVGADTWAWNYLK